MRHYAPTYRLAAFRADGHPLTVENGLASELVVQARIAALRRFYVGLYGEDPLFKVYRVSQDGSVEVTAELLVQGGT